MNTSVESIIDESMKSNCSIIGKIHPKGMSFLDLIAIFAMSFQSFAYFYSRHKDMCNF